MKWSTMPHRSGSLFALSLLLVFALAGCLADGDGSSNLEGGDGPGGPDPAKPGRGSISGQVLGVDGPLAGALVDLSRVFRSVETGPDGRFEFDDLLATDYRLTVTAEHHRRASATVNVKGGQAADVVIDLRPIMLTADIPAKYGKQVVAVNTQDTLFVSAGLPLLGLQQAVTNETSQATFPGFWEIVPEDGYRVAQISVIIAWANLPELDQPLGLHYFRGESPLENELVEGATADYHVPEPAMSGSVFAVYSIQNEDWETWGERNWQLGVFVREGEHPVSFGAVVEHIVSIVVTLVDVDYLPQK